MFSEIRHGQADDKFIFSVWIKAIIISERSLVKKNITRDLNKVTIDQNILEKMARHMNHWTCSKPFSLIHLVSFFLKTVGQGKTFYGPFSIWDVRLWANQNTFTGWIPITPVCILLSLAKDKCGNVKFLEIEIMILNCNININKGMLSERTPDWFM